MFKEQKKNGMCTLGTEHALIWCEIFDKDFMGRSCYPYFSTSGFYTKEWNTIRDS